MSEGTWGDYQYEIRGSKGDNRPYYFYFQMNNIGLIPAVRQTQASAHRNPRARKYNAQQGTIRDLVVLQMRANGLNPAPANLRLQARVQVRRKLTRSDVDNLLKAALDALQGGPYENDLCIWEASVQKIKDADESFSVELMEMK